MQNRALGVVASTLLMAASAAQDQERLPPVPLFLDSRVSPMPLFMADTVALYPAHLDGDRHLDLVVVNRRPGVTYPYAGSWVLRGVGDGRLRNDAPYDEYNWRLILGAADLDGDGDIDLPFQHEFVPGMGIGINNGSGGFTWHYGVVPFPTSTLVTVDVDGDGDVDLCNGLRLFLNAGTLQFVEVTATHLPPPGGFAEPPVLATGDFDGDGDVDLLLGNRSGQDRLYLNDGTGRFIDATATHLPAQSGATRGLAVGDLDGDGDLDVAIGLPTGGELLVQVGGAFTRSNAWDPQLAPTAALVFCDIDGDLDPDLVQGGANPTGTDASCSLESRTFLNDGSGHFLHVELSPLEAPFRTQLSTRIAAAGDFDGDGDLDLLDASDGGRLLVNDGFGAFQTRELNLPVSGRPLVGDLDADGDVDVVLVDRAGAFHVLRNPGDGNLWPVFSQWLNLGAAALEAGALGDIDGDNDLDLMLVTWRGGMPPPPVPPDALWLNTGNGTFVDASQRLTGTPSNATDVALGDIDNDGDLDVVTTGGVLYRNTGTALVSEPFHILYNLGESHIVLAHLDGDGYLDLAAGNACRGRGCAPSGAGGWDVVHFNDGRGGFDSGTVLLQQSSMATSVAVGDVDGDGDNDVLIGHVGARGSGHDNPAENTLFLNQGDRTFRKATIDEFPFDLDATVAVILADIDGDTDIDFVACNEALSTGARRGKVHVNVLQHLWAPAFARLGRNFPLVVYGARHGAEVWASAGAVRIPVPPFGLLGLDPASLVTLKRLPGSSGPMQIDLNVPNDPALAGGVLYFQALLFGASPQAARLSNRLTHTVHPH